MRFLDAAENSSLIRVTFCALHIESNMPNKMTFILNINLERDVKFKCLRGSALRGVMENTEVEKIP